LLGDILISSYRDAFIRQRRPHLGLAASNGLAFLLIRGAFHAIARRRPLFPLVELARSPEKGFFILHGILL
jgi:hypothetical protein